MILQETYKLENGTKIPKLGLGTWCIDNDKAAQTVRTAVTLGIVSLILHRPTKMSRALARESIAAAFPVRSCLSQARWPQN